MRGHRASLYGDIILPFPPGLMNTAVSPAILNGSRFARHIENMLPNVNKAGSGSKRFGFGKKGADIGQESLASWEYRNGSGQLEILGYFGDGSIRRLNEGTGAWTTLKSGLAGTCVPGALAFNSKLVIYNGVNPLQVYDGGTVSTVKEWVSDSIGSGATWASSSSFTIATNRTDYQNGRRVRVTFETAGVVVATISGVAGSGTLTVSVVGTPFPGSSQAIEKVEYEMDAPALSFLYAEHDRLWGLSEGVPHPTNYRGGDSLKVFYTETANVEGSWYNQLGAEPTQELNFFNIENKARKFDELVAISSINGLMVFHGRLQSYVYGGTNPTPEGDFAWQKTLPVGCVNGQLVIRFPGDVLFMTRYGARSLAQSFQTEGLEVSPDIGSNMDAAVTNAVAQMMRSVDAYRAARSFFYEKDGFYGFKVDGQYVFAYVLSEQSKGWVYLSGLFEEASCFLATSDGRLFVGSDGQLYGYANGTDDDIGTSYGDDGEPIFMMWWLPWLSKPNQRWGNLKFEVILESTASTTLSIYRAVDYNDNTVKPIATNIDLTAESAFWDEAEWDVALWDGTPKRVVVRDKFVCNAFWAQIQNNSTEGPISILALRAIGK